MNQNHESGANNILDRGLYDVSGTLQSHFREHPNSFNEIMVIIFRLLEINIFGVVRENNKITAQLLHNIPGPKYGFTSLSGGNQVDGLPPACSFNESFGPEGQNFHSNIRCRILRLIAAT